MFIPSLGLFDLLHHWKYEQIPFKVRLEYAKNFPINPNDKIILYGLNETVFWLELDRWDYTNKNNPTPPHYSLYTLLSLKETFVYILILSIIQFMFIYVMKNYTSPDFKKELHRLNKMIHVLENMNYSTPFKDWDHGVFPIKELKLRFKTLKKEMIVVFVINFIFTLIMMGPLWFCGKNRTKYLRL